MEKFFMELPMPIKNLYFWDSSIIGLFAFQKVEVIAHLSMTSHPFWGIMNVVVQQMVRNELHTEV